MLATRFLVCLISVAPIVAASQPSCSRKVVCQVGVWDDAKHSHLAALAAQKQEELLEGVGAYHYPFALPLRYALDRQEQMTVPILAFGSLMSRQSAAQTLNPETLNTMRPAVAFGLKRLYNYDVSQSKGYGRPQKPQARGMLNSETSPSTRDVVNGIVIDLPKDELLTLCERETGYDLVPVVTIDWEAALSCSEPRFYVTYALRAVDHPQLGQEYTNANILPFDTYHDAVKTAAAEHGPEFLSLYMRSTYLADGKTTIQEWEEQK